MTLHICWGPRMVERKREYWQTRWCFQCRKHLAHYAVLLVAAEGEEDWYGPSWVVQCYGCGEDHVHFPGCEPDGPTLRSIDDP